MRFAARAFPLLAFVLAAYLLTACVFSRGDDEPALGDVNVLTGSGVLVCSDACAQRGQCGATGELGDVVLASTGLPSTRGHDVAVPTNTLVAINLSQPEPVVESATGAEFLVNYYLVTVPNRPFPAWVAGWCVASPP